MKIVFLDSKTIGDDIDLSPKFHLELIEEFVKRAERHGVAAN